MLGYELSHENFKVLNEKKIRRIHFGVLEVLETAGVRVENETALRLLHDAHCAVDFDKKIVKIPEHVLQDALSSVPTAITLCGQRSEYDVRLKLGEKTYMVGAAAALYVLDTNNQRRLATLKDLIDLTRLHDYLEHCHIMQQMVIPHEISRIKQDRISFATVMANSPKHNWAWAEDPEGVEDHIRMASLILGDKEKIQEKPIFSESVCFVSPLWLPNNDVGILIKSAQHKLPLFVEVDPMCGATSPVTIAGTLLQQTATVLCGIVITQLINPGAPCLYTIASGLMDMRNGNYAGATPEITLLYIASIQIAHYYGLLVTVGNSVDAKISDAQAGYEKALQFLPVLLAQPDVIHLTCGMLEQMRLLGYGQSIIDNEIIGAASRFMKGIEISDETLAVRVICETGPGGNYLTHPHTLKFLRKELWMPEIANRDRWESWGKKGRKTLQETANEKAKEILEKHHPKPLSDSVEKELNEMAENLHKRALP